MSNKGSGNKPKKSKNDVFRATLGIYLKQKSYVGNDKFRKSDFLLLQSKKQFVLQKMLESDMPGGNCFAYSNVRITNNQHIVDQQFARFSQFVESQNEIIRTELKRLYGPMLCHLYLELMKAREPRAAVDFLKKYAHLLAPVDTYDAPLSNKLNGCANDIASETTAASVIQNFNIRFVRDANTAEDPELHYFMKLIQILSTCSKLETAENDAEIAHFRSSKYEIHTTAAVIDTLSTYLEKRGHVLLLNLLCTWIRIHIIDHEVQQWTEDNLFLATENEDNEDDLATLQQPTYKKPLDAERLTKKRQAATEHAEHKILSDDKTAKIVKTESETEETDAKKHYVNNVRTCLQTLQETSEAMLKAQTDFPRFIKLSDKCKGLTSAHLDANECHLVAGYNNSVVQLWQMNQQTCCGKNLYRQKPDTLCCWELNNCLQEDDDEIEHDIKEHARMSIDRRKEKYNEGKYEDNSYNEYGGIQLRGHGLGVTEVRFSKHYPLIYSVSKDATMRSWRAENYACAAVYRGHRYPIWCVDESPVGMYLATGSKDLSARLWSLEHEFPLITYAGHTQDVECLAFHPNGNYIATGSADLSVRLWCVTSGKLMRIFSDCKLPVTCIAFSPDGKLLAAGGEETKIRIFDLAAGTQLHELKDHTANVTSIAWNAAGRQLATVCRDGSLRLWDVKKLHESGSTTTHSSSSSNPATTNAATTNTTSTSAAGTTRLMALNSNCQRLVKVLFSHNGTISCIGSTN